jgi:ADP-ribose pyrophosphatase YjhB (NUDIX family)
LKTFFEFIASRQQQYWGPVSRVSREEGLVRIEADHLGEPLYGHESTTTLANGPFGKVLSPPWNKYFVYQKDERGRNVITYAENRAVDCVPYNRTHNAVYLITRLKSPTGLAIPGGFFDNDADGFKATNPPPAASVAPKSAARELNEETGSNVDPADLRFVGEFDGAGSDEREKHVRTWAYTYLVPDEEMPSFRFGDDAAQAQGSEDMAEKGFKGWYSLGNIPPLAFGHHDRIIRKIAGG